MAELAENQLLLLNNSIYLKGVAVDEENYTVEKAINYLLYNCGLDLSKYENV